MRKVKFVIIILCLFCSTITAPAQQLFYKDSSMNDLSKEKEMVSQLMYMTNEMAKYGITKTDSNGKQRGLPLSEKQLIQLLKCMNVATQSKGKLLIVPVNTENGKIVQTYVLDVEKKEKKIGEWIHLSKYIHLLQSDKIDFRLIRAYGKFKEPIDKSIFQSEEFLNNRKNYVHLKDCVKCKYPVLFRDIYLYSYLNWEKDFNHKNTEQNRFRVIDMSAFCTTSTVGDFKETNYLAYKEKDNLIGETNGKVTMFINFNKNSIKINIFIRSKTIIDIESGVGKVYAEAYKIELE